MNYERKCNNATLHHEIHLLVIPTITQCESFKKTLNLFWGGLPPY